MHSDFQRHIHDKTILITGGTGSFGNSVIVELLKMQPKKIIIFSRDESKQHEMRIAYNNPHLKFVIGDVRDRKSLDKSMSNVDFVFHAAAMKHVPTCEFFPLEAVNTNILGTDNVIDVAIKNRVKRVILLSTDKAVYPTNLLGMSKAIAEKVMIAESKNLHDSKNSDTILCGVRFGNILYSRGSVLPHFVSLMQQKKMLEVTNYQMTRFLLAPQDAVSLVLYALLFGKNGYLYVKKSPACVLETLTKAFCEICTYTIGYKEVGIRAGEKMHEALLTTEELSRAEDNGDYYSVPPESQGLDYNKYFIPEKRNSNNIKPYTSEYAKKITVKEAEKILLRLPEIQTVLKNKRKK